MLHSDEQAGNSFKLSGEADKAVCLSLYHHQVFFMTMNKFKCKHVSG